jgi:hypothetical protein
MSGCAVLGSARCSCRESLLNTARFCLLYSIFGQEAEEWTEERGCMEGIHQKYFRDFFNGVKLLHSALHFQNMESVVPCVAC